MARPVALTVHFDDGLRWRLTVQTPQITVFVEFHGENQFVFLVDFIENFDGRIFVVIMFDKLAIFKFIDTVSRTGKHAVRVHRIHVEFNDSRETQTRRLADVYGVERTPFIVFQSLDNTSFVGESVRGIKRSIDKFQVFITVEFRSVGIHIFHLFEQFGIDDFRLWMVVADAVPIGFVEQVAVKVGGVESVRFRRSEDFSVFDVAMVHLETELISIADFTLGNVDFQNAEPRGNIGELVVIIDVVHGFVARHRFHIVFGHIRAVSVGFEQVDVLVFIDDDKPFRLLVPRDMGNRAVAQRIHFTEGSNAVVLRVVEIEILTGKHEKFVTGLLDFGDMGVCQICLPRTDAGGLNRGCSQKNGE